MIKNIRSVKLDKISNAVLSINKSRKNILLKARYDVISIKVYALDAMAKLPFGRYFNWLFKRLDYQSIGKTMMVVAQKR